MNAASATARHPSYIVNKPADSFGWAIAYSFVFHLSLLAVMYTGLPYIKKEPIVLNTATVEIVQVDEKTTTNRPPQRRSPPRMDEAPAPPQNPVSPKMDASAPPKLTDPTPPRLAEDLNRPVTPSVPAPDQKPETRPKPSPEEKKPDPKETEQAEDASFNSLLRNLTPHAPTERAESDPDKSLGRQEQEPSPLARFAQQVTMSEMDALRAQLARCWNIPAGVEYAENLVVAVRIFVNPDRSVRDAQILDKGRYNRDAPFRAAADSAIRAVYGCSPLNLPPDKYDQWKTVVVRFDPREMLL